MTKRTNPSRSVPRVLNHEGGDMLGDRSRTDFAGSSTRRLARRTRKRQDWEQATTNRIALEHGGSMPVSGLVPKPPPVLVLYEDLVGDELGPSPVYGQYPRALIAKILPWLRCGRHEILHVCSGSLKPGEGIRVDLRPEAKPDILADGRKLPLPDGSVAAVMIDPPYSVEYARTLYGVEYPRPSHLLREAARVVRRGGANRHRPLHHSEAGEGHALRQGVRAVHGLRHADARRVDLRARSRGARPLMPNLALNFDRRLWHRIPDEDPYASRFFDGHYSRQTPGARGILAPGFRGLWWHEGPRGPAMWGVVHNRFRKRWRWRNTVFRNKSGTLSIALIEAATETTFDYWRRRYGGTPSLPFESEIDIEATRARRGKDRPPGYCYECAGWTWVRSTLAGHGRCRKAVYEAPQ